ncbi:DUF3037 domain-containing protein [Myroides indicus]|uniref:DUF3037 family protein n=1 Tax=Myroides indicus TaxID=1323422 RepID=A0A4R7EXA3_9FLAO|nr:DUF3037 domain-containing protein [Myroides indicus]TDS53840.1 hypothetical protein C8P70_12737 [Myroides indicus]
MEVYEYAVIRFVPKVEREEFVNIGLVFFCKSSKNIYFKYHLDKKKITSFSTEVEYEVLKNHLETFQMIAEGKIQKTWITQFDIAERFRWITAIKSSCIQTSRPHSGIVTKEDLESTFERIFREMIL